MYIDMLNSSEFPGQNYATLRTAVITGSPCPTHLRQVVAEKFKLRDVLIIYGTTENSPATNMTKRNDPPATKLTSVGRPLDHVEVKIADHDGCPVQVGSPGEVWTRGYMIMHSYWHDVDKTREVIGDDRWYRTGYVNSFRLFFIL